MRSRAALQTPEAREYQIKAVFLYNFALFVDWPPAAFSGPQAPLVIGILGDDPFGPYLDAAVTGERVNGRALEIRRYKRVSDIKECHVIFISRSESGRMGEVLNALRGRGILTVGDTADFNTEGGAIRLAVENSKVRLKIDLEHAKEAHLTISSKLLGPAEIVSH